MSLTALLPLLVLVACARGSSSETGAPPLALGEALPALTVQDHQGREHRLPDPEGRIVVLEWTSHLCPSVAAWYDAGEMQRLQRELGERVLWLAVDSSFFAALGSERIAAWREERALEAPCLLDQDGRLGRLLGAKATPELCVLDRRGRLVYRGAPSEWRRGKARGREHLLEAVSALERETPLSLAETRAEGCSVKYRPRELEEEPERLPALCFEWARGYARERMHAPALSLLEAALRAGWPTPSDVLSDARFRPLRGAAHRPALELLLEEHAREPQARIVDEREPGEPLIVRGRVLGPAGEPLAGALLRVWQTDAQGLYSESGLDETSPRLFAWLRTDAEGRFELRTIRPAAYAVSPEVEADEGPFDQHVHFLARAPGHLPRETRLGFRDDPVWARLAGLPPDPRFGERPPDWAAEVTRDREGIAHCELTIELARE